HKHSNSSFDYIEVCFWRNPCLWRISTYCHCSACSWIPRCLDLLFQASSHRRLFLPLQRIRLLGCKKNCTPRHSFYHKSNIPFDHETWRHLFCEILPACNKVQSGIDRRHSWHLRPVRM